MAYFDETMKKGVSASGLKMGWINVNMSNGKFEKADWANLKEVSAEKYDIMEMPFIFQKGNMNLRVSFNKDGTVGGLWILAAN